MCVTKDAYNKDLSDKDMPKHKALAKMLPKCLHCGNCTAIVVFLFAVMGAIFFIFSPCSVVAWSSVLVDVVAINVALGGVSSQYAHSDVNFSFRIISIHDVQN